MVAVGDRHRSARGGGQQRSDHLDRVAIGRDRPQPVPRPVLVGQVDVGGPRRDRVEDRTSRAVPVVVEADDGARVHPGRTQQLVAILARTGHRALVRQHARSGPVRLQPDPREEPALGSRHVRARHAIGLLVDVDGRMGILVQGPIRPPRGQDAGGPTVAIVGLVAGLLDRQVEADDVGRVPGEQPFALVRTDDVIRRCHDEREVGDGGRIVAKGTERTDVGHGTSRRRLSSRRLCRDRRIVR